MSGEDQMGEAIRRQLEQRTKSHHVDRRGWTRQQWIDDARTLMDHIDGAITSLVNGHVLALLEEAQSAGELRAAIKSGVLWVEPCPECAAGKHRNCTLTVPGIESNGDEVPCPCVSFACAWRDNGGAS